MIRVTLHKDGDRFIAASTVYEGPLGHEEPRQIQRWSRDPMIAIGRFINYEGPRFGYTRDVIVHETYATAEKYFIYSPLLPQN